MGSAFTRLSDVTLDIPLIPAGVKREVFRHFLYKVFGDYIEHSSIQADELTVDLQTTQATVCDIRLEQKTVNAKLQEHGAGIELLSGAINEVKCTIPWSTLNEDNCQIRMTGIRLCVRPCAPVQDVRSGDRLAESVMAQSFSTAMTESMTIVEEIMRKDQQGSAVVEQPAGMTAISSLLESVFDRVEVVVEDIIIRVEFDLPNNVALEAHIGKVSMVGAPARTSLDSTANKSMFDMRTVDVSNATLYFDAGEPSSHAAAASPPPPAAPTAPTAITSSVDAPSAKLRATEAIIEQPISNAVFQSCNSSSSDDSDNDDGIFASVHDSFSGSVHDSVNDSFSGSVHDSAEPDAVSSSVAGMSTNLALEPFATLSGESRLTIILKKEKKSPGPQVQVEGFLSNLDVFLSPAQLSRGLELLSSMDGHSANTAATGGVPLTTADMSLVMRQREKFALRNTLAKSSAALEQAEHEHAQDPFSSADSPWYRPTAQCPDASSLRTVFGDANDSGDEEEAFHSARSNLSKVDDFHSFTSSSACSSIGTGSLPKSKWSPAVGKRKTANEEIVSQQPGPGVQLQPQRKKPSPSHGPAATSAPPPSSAGKRAMSADGDEDLIQYKLKVHSISVVLLEQDPPGTPPASPNSPSGVMRNGLSRRYFGKLKRLAPSGLHSSPEPSTVLSQCGSQNLLRLYVAPFHSELTRCSLAGQSCTTSLHFSAGSASLAECIYSGVDSLAGVPLLSPAITEILNVGPHENSRSSGKASLDVKLEMRRPSLKQRHNRKPPMTTVDVQLEKTLACADITLSCRLQPLIKALSVLQAKDTAQQDPGASFYSPAGRSADVTASVRTRAYNRAMDETDSRAPFYSLAVKCERLELSARFPIADLRSARYRCPWWRLSLRPEVLLICANDLVVTSNRSQMSSDHVSSIGIKFNDAAGYWQNSVDDRDRLLFAQLRPNATDGQQLEEHLTSDIPEVTIVRRNFAPSWMSGNLSEEPDETIDDNSATDSFIPIIVGSGGPPTPFSKLVTMNISGTVSGDTSSSSKKRGKKSGDDDAGGPVYENQVFPGDDGEMKEFEESAATNSKLLVSVAIPILKVHFPSKSFFELLYNRIVNDLLMWVAPEIEPVVHLGNMGDFQIPPLQLRTDLGKVFGRARDAMMDSFYAENPDRESPVGGFMTQKSGGQDDLHNELALVLKVGEISLTALTDVQVPSEVDSSECGSGDGGSGAAQDGSDVIIPDLVGLASVSAPPAPLVPELEKTVGRIGEFRLNFGQAQICVVSGVQAVDGDVLCSIQSKEATLDHCHSVPSMQPLVVAVSDEDVDDEYLNSVIKAAVTERGTTKIGGQRIAEGNSNGLAVGISLSKAKGSELKEFQASIMLSDVMLHHRTVGANESSWLSELFDYVSLVDQEIPGYTVPQTCVNVSVHFKHAALLYRPIYMPLSVALTMGLFSITCSVVNRSSGTLLNLLADDVALYLSNCADDLNIARDFICIASLVNMSFRLRKEDVVASSFQADLISSSGDTDEQTGTAGEVASEEATMLISDDSDSEPSERRPPPQYISTSRLSLASSKLVVSTCSDSFAALTHLVSYIASDGDLKDLSLPPAITVESEPVEPCQPLLHGAAASSNRETYEQQIADAVNVATEDTRTGRAASVSPASSRGKSRASVQSRAFDESDSDSEDEMAAKKRLPLMELAPDLLSSTQSGRASGLSSPSGPVVNLDALNDALDEEWEEVERPIDPQTKYPKTCSWGVITRTDGGGAVVEDYKPSSSIKPLSVIPNAFPKPAAQSKKADTLDPAFPEKYGIPQNTYHLTGFNLTWQMVGGEDFKTEKEVSVDAKKTSTTRRQASAPVAMAVRSGRRVLPSRSSRTSEEADQIWKGRTREKTFGGPGRKKALLLELCLTKMRFKYDIFPVWSAYVSRFALAIADVEILDRVFSSKINKFMYRHNSEVMPKLTSSEMVAIKVLVNRCDKKTSLVLEEADVALHIQPLRFNLDQDTIMFMIDFFNAVGASKGAPAENQGTEHGRGGGDAAAASAAASNTSPGSSPLSSSAQAALAAQLAQAQAQAQANDKTRYSRDLSSGSRTSGDNEQRQQQQRQPEPDVDQPMFIKGFISSPVLIVIDYNGKHVDMDQGAFLGVIYGLAQIRKAEICLRSLTYRRGISGWDRLVKKCLDDWRDDILKTQLAGIVGGVGPLHAMRQFVQGITDLIAMPVNQYRRDGRILWGLQRGASSFSLLTAVSTLELSSRLMQTVQGLAETMYDLVTPSDVQQLLVLQQDGRYHAHRDAMQPADLREAATSAATVLKTGFSEAASNLMRAASVEHRSKGVPGAVGGVLRQLPSTIVQPVVAASEATVHVLDGMKNQLLPDARREAEEKYRREAT